MVVLYMPRFVVRMNKLLILFDQHLAIALYDFICYSHLITIRSCFSNVFHTNLSAHTLQLLHYV